MCEKCVENVKRLFPEIEEKHMCTLLMSCTCFPFGEPEDVLKMLEPMSKRYNSAERSEGWQKRWLHEEMALADEELRKEMEHFKANSKPISSD